MKPVRVKIPGEKESIPKRSDKNDVKRKGQADPVAHRRDGEKHTEGDVEGQAKEKNGGTKGEKQGGFLELRHGVWRLKA